MRAALLTDPSSPLEIVEDLDLAEPRPGEVCVAVSHSGICHSDLTVIEGGYMFPAVLGHEAAGVVDAGGGRGRPPIRG